MSRIIDAIKEETVVSGESIREFEEDVRVAQKEQLRSHQKRNDLLNSLKKSICDTDYSTGKRSAYQKEFKRLIRDGCASEIQVFMQQYMKELGILHSKGMLTHEGENKMHLFSERIRIFQEKKSLLEKFEKTIEAQSHKKSSDNSESSVSASADLALAKMYDLTSTLRSDISKLLTQLLPLFEDLETSIQEGLEKEETARQLLFASLAVIQENHRRNVMNVCHKAMQHASIEKRTALFRHLVQQLARSFPPAASKIHSILREKARSLVKQGLYQKAISELCYAIQLCRNQVETYRLLANIFFRQKDYPNAYIALGEVLRLHPEDVQLRKRVAKYYVSSGKDSKAIRELEEIISRDPQDKECRMMLGKLQFKSAHYSQCIEQLLSCYRDFPQNSEVLTCLGLAYYYQQDWHQAIHFLQKADQQKPGDKKIVVPWVQSLCQLNLEGDAIRILTRCIRDNPDSISFRLLLGRLYRENEQWEEAEKIFMTFLQNNPPSSPVLTALAHVQLQSGKIDDAIRHLEQVLSDDPNNEEAYLFLSRAYQQNGDPRRAEEILLQAETVMGFRESIKQELVVLYTQQNKWQEAASIIHRESVKDSSDPTSESTGVL